MSVSQTNNLRQQAPIKSGEMTLFASRLLQFTGLDSSAAAPIGHGYCASPEIFAMGRTLSRWPHAASTKTADRKTDFFQEEDHERDE